MSKQYEKLHSLDYEKAVLSSLMSLDCYAKFDGELSEDLFYAKRHQAIFAIIKNLFTSGMPYGTIDIFDYAENQGLMADIGGEEYLGQIIEQSPATLFNLENYIKRLQDFAQRRAMFAEYETAKAKLLDFTLATDEVVNETAESINKTMQTTANESYASVNELLGSFLDELQRNAREGFIPSKKTGLIELDNKCRFMDGELVVIAGRPSMGKTTLAQNILTNIAENEEGHAVFFSLEMPKNQIMNRLMSSVAKVEMDKIFSGQGLAVEDWESMMKVTERLKNLPLTIDDRGGLTVAKMRTTLNKIRQEKGKVSAVLVDYVQLMTSSKPLNNRNAEVEEISRGLKQLAKEFDCPMIALSQLSRSLEKRPDKRPIMSDLRDSGAIEQDADHVIFIYRDEVYKADSKEKGVAELLVRKQRNGSTGTVKVAFDGKYNRFIDLVYMPSDDEMPFLQENA